MCNNVDEFEGGKTGKRENAVCKPEGAATYSFLKTVFGP